MNTQKLHWITQVIACTTGLVFALRFAFLAGRTNQLLAFTIMIIAAFVCAALISIRFRQNPYT